MVAMAQKPSDSVTVSNYAGSGAYKMEDGNLETASFGKNRAMCKDANNNLYMIDVRNDIIRKITPEGVVSTFAGSGVRGDKDGMGKNAQFNELYDLCIDAFGNMYVADLSNHKIRKIEPNGKVTTLVGKSDEPGDIDGNRADVRLNKPVSLCISGFNLYVYDYRNQKIKAINIFNGSTSTYAGNGTTGIDNGPKLSASFTYVIGMCADANGNIFISETFHSKIRKISAADGMVTTYAGLDNYGHSDGTLTTATFHFPGRLIIDSKNNIYVCDNALLSNVFIYATIRTNSIIRKISPSGNVTTIAGGEDNDKGYNRNKHRVFILNGVGSVSTFDNLSGIVFIGDTIYTSEVNNPFIRKIVKTPITLPKVEYVELPASVCLGSTMDYQPTNTGSAAGLSIFTDSIDLKSTPVAICKNNNAVFVLTQDFNILKLNYNGDSIATFPYFGQNHIAADDQGRIYFADFSPANSNFQTIKRLNADGTQDNGFELNNLVNFNCISSLALSPNGVLYVGDTCTGFLSTIDTATGAVNNLPNATLYQPTGMDFDKDGNIIMAIPYYDNLFTDNGAGQRDLLFSYKFDTLNYKINSIAATATPGQYFASSPTQFLYIFNGINANGDTIANSLDFKQFVSVATPLAVLNVPSAINTGVPTAWVADASSNYLKRISLFNYTISPPLPAGLNFNFLGGNITGSPTQASPLQEYTITVTSDKGTTTNKISFGVGAIGSLNNNMGTMRSGVINHTDGLEVKFYEDNNCAELLSVKDAKGGMSPGATQVKQTVSPLASFNSGKFVGRVNEVNAQNPKAGANLKLFFTYEDIANFNSSNGTDADLTNDTTGKTMQVAVLQLHTDTNGRKQQIYHNPIAAKWESKNKRWTVDFPITKFSEFYMGTTTTLDTFTCENTDYDTVTSNNYYIFDGDSIIESGNYEARLVNASGCDSTVFLNLTIDKTISITPLLANSLSIYPNPANGIVNIAISDRNVKMQNVRLLNVLGAEVLNVPSFKTQTAIDVSALPKGIYIVQIASQNEILSKKIVVE